MTGDQPPRTAQAVDWSELRDRLQRVSQALASGGDLSPAEVRELLEERAQALARPAEAKPEQDRLEVVRFSRGDTHYALESRFIHEIVPLGPVAFLPGVAPPVVGAVAWRGEVLVLVDVDQAEGELPSDNGNMLVVGEERPAFGVLADAVAGLGRVLPSALGELEAAGMMGRREVRGITNEGVLVLNGAALLQRHS